MGDVMEACVRIPKVQFKKSKRKQVKRACINCRKSKTGCEDKRPCSRCIQLGISNTCTDAPCHKIQNTKSISPSLPTNSQIPLPVNNPSNTKIPQNQNIYLPQQYKNISDPHNVNQSFLVIKSEKQILCEELAELQRESLMKETLISSLQVSLLRQNSFSTLPLSKWKLSPGVCRLVSYSNGFIELTQYPVERLQACFTSIQLYPPEELSKTQIFLDLICSGTVVSFTTRAPILTASGTIKNVISSLYIEFQNDLPDSVCFCMKEYDPGGSDFTDVPYFQPFLVKTKSIPVRKRFDANVMYPVVSYSYATVPSGDNFVRGNSGSDFYVPDVNTLNNEEVSMLQSAPPLSASNIHLPFARPVGIVEEETPKEKPSTAEANVQCESPTEASAFAFQNSMDASEFDDFAQQFQYDNPVGESFLDDDTIDLSSDSFSFENLFSDQWDRGKPVLNFGS